MPEAQETTEVKPNGAPPAIAAPAPAPAPPEVSMEVLKYKEELLQKMGLPSAYGMEIMKKLCYDLVESGFAPSHFKGNPMALYLAAMRGREMDLSPIESILETFWAAPGGRLGMYANKMLDIMHRRNVISKFITETKDRCEILFTPPAPHIPYNAIFDFAEAITANLVKPDSNWIKWPSDMNKARAIARGWRALAGTFKGAANLYAKEELEDMAPEYVAAQPDLPADQPVVEVLAGRRKKVAAAEPGQVIEMPIKAAAVDEPPVSTVSVTYAFDKLDELDQPNYDTACLRAQAIANARMLPVKIIRITTLSDGTRDVVEVGEFMPPGSPAPAVVAATATTETATAAADPAKEALVARARAAYALIPAAEEKARKQIGDMFCCGFYGVSVPREWPRNIEDRTAGVDGLETAIRTDIQRLTQSPVTARDFGRELAAKRTDKTVTAKAAAAQPAADPSASLYKKLGWSPATCEVAGRFKTRYGIEAQDLADYVASLKLDFLADEDARAYMSFGAAMGRIFKPEGAADHSYPMKTLFALCEKGGGTYSIVMQTIEMYNDAKLADIPQAKIMADLNKMMAKLDKPAAQAEPGADEGWG